MNPNTITGAANPVDDTAYADAWRDPEGRAAFERIVATERSASQSRRRGVRRFVAVGVAVTMAAAATAAVAVVTGTSGAHDALSHARPAAWTVTENPDGTVTVWFRDYRDPEGLQARLRAAGVRADVGTLSASCYPPSTGAGRWAVLLVEPSMSRADVEHLFPITQKQELAIDPRYLPADATIGVGFPPATAPAADRFFSLAVEPTDAGPTACPLEIAKAHQSGQLDYVAPRN